MNRTLGLMVGLPGQGMHLGIDSLSVFFLCLLVPQVLASAVTGAWKSPNFWIVILGMALTLLAADAFALVLGIGLMDAAVWLLVLRADRRAANLYAAVAISAAACLIPAVFLPAGGASFALLVLGASSKAGLAPLHSWLPRTYAAPSSATAAMLSGGTTKIVIYVIIRYGFIVFGNAIQPWWAAVLIAAGAASVLVGGLRAMLEIELKTVLACSTVAQVGLIAIGLGLALWGRSLDDPALASLALQAALLGALAHTLVKPLLCLGVGAVQQATGTTSLDWLGGLMRGMPRLGLLMLLGAAGMAALPLGPGFAPEFLLLHAVIAAAGSGGAIAGIGFTALLGVLGIGAALVLAAAVRIVGIGFLGRPRTLRAAAAEEASRKNLTAMGLLAVCCVPLALTPGLLLTAIQPVILQLVPGALPQPSTYAPVSLLALMLVPAAAAFFAFRRWAARGEREVPAWNGGFGKPPAWLPFGDPATQPTATGLAQPMQLVLGSVLLPQGRDPGDAYILAPLRRLHRQLTCLAEWVSHANLHQSLAFVFAALVVCLLVLGLGQDG